ncbi:MAG: YqaE/Pmp3 family membrane protein [Bacteroidetes bacterium]|nr:YqaE/Pmp3 family membrane protein [Bacteroidota bacterium]
MASYVVVTDQINPANQSAKSRSEKRADRKVFKHTIKALVKKLRVGNPDASQNTVLLAILSILLPPLAVYLHQGEVNNKFWLSLVLTLLGWLPGIIYALVVVLGAV